MSADLASQGEGRSSFGVPDAASVISGTLESMGYELVEMEFGQRGLLRVYIDAPAGIRLEDCEKVSRQLNHLLTVENIQYDRLEVSSPGLDRPLRKPADFARFAGERATVRLRQAFQGRRNFEGLLTVEDDGKFGLELLPENTPRQPGKRPPRQSPAKPSRSKAGVAADAAGQASHKLVFSLDEIERARLVPIVKF